MRLRVDRPPAIPPVTARALAAGLALLLSACGDDARAGEIACQRRLVELSGDVRPGPPGSGLAGVFSRASERFDRMPLDRCTDAQRSIARSFAKVTREIASRAGRLGDDPLRALERDAKLRTSDNFRELQSLIEGVEHRRRLAREDLERMIRDERPRPRERSANPPKPGGERASEPMT